MDATCNVQDSIHVFHLVHNMCPGFWVHIKAPKDLFLFNNDINKFIRDTNHFHDVLAIDFCFDFFVS